MENIQANQQKNVRFKGILCVFASFLISLISAIAFSLGMLFPYQASQMKDQDSIANKSNLFLLSPIHTIFMNLGLHLANLLGKKWKWKIRWICLLAIFILALSFLVNAWIKSFTLIVLFWAIPNGIATGLTNFMPVVHCWQFFPKWKGFYILIIIIILALVSGTVWIGQSFGPFVWNFLILWLINPKNELPILPDENDIPNQYFSSSIAANVPFFFRVFSAISFGIGILAVAILFEYPSPNSEKDATISSPCKQNQDEIELQSSQISLQENRWNQQKPSNSDKEEGANLNSNAGTSNTSKNNEIVKINENSEMKKANDSNEYECNSVKQGLCSLVFQEVTIIAFFGTFGGTWPNNIYKFQGQQLGFPEFFITLTGSLGILSQILSRITGAILMDMFGFKKISFSTCLIIVIFSAVFPFVSQWQGTQMAFTIVLFLTYGTFPPILSAHSVQLFGMKQGRDLQGFIFFGQIFSTLLVFFLNKFAIKQIGYNNSWWITFSLGAIAAFLSIITNAKRKWPKA